MAVEVIVKENNIEDIKFFGAADSIKRDDEGNPIIGSALPAWYHKGKIKKLEEEIKQKKIAIEREAIRPGKIMETKERLSKLEKQLDRINDSKPELKGPLKDKVKILYDKLGKEISDNMFTRNQMEIGTASVHGEYYKMVEPIISVSKSLARACNIRIENSPSPYTKVNLSNAGVMWKILGCALGEATNTETLRRQG